MVDQPDPPGAAIPLEPDDYAWALERVTQLCANALADAQVYGQKLLKGFGYPNETFRAAQDYRALNIVLAALSLALQRAEAAEGLVELQSTMTGMQVALREHQRSASATHAQALRDLVTTWRTAAAEYGADGAAETDRGMRLAAYALQTRATMCADELDQILSSSPHETP